MSRINKGLYSSEAQDWWTPPVFIQALLGFIQRPHFTLDPCCSAENIPAIEYYIDGEADGLALPWYGDVFVNPPYGKALRDWLKKCAHEAKDTARIWALVPARTETIYQHDYGIASASFTVFMKKRVKFIPSPTYRPVLLRKRFRDALLSEKNSDRSWVAIGREIIRDAEKGTAPFPTMLLYWGNDWAEVAARWLDKKPWPGTLMVRGDAE